MANDMEDNQVGRPSQRMGAHISKALENLNKARPELAPHVCSTRIAALLDDIGHPEAIVGTTDAGINDLWLPIRETGQSLGLCLSDSAFELFEKTQPLYLSNTFTIPDRSEWPAAHENLAKEAIKESKGMPKTLSPLEGLGVGGHGSVAKVSDSVGRVYALKRIERKTLLPKEARDQMKYIKIELDVLRRIRHHHFIRLVGSYTETSRIGILMDPVADCNLQQYLDGFQHNETNKAQLASFFGCLATALAHLHYRWNIRHKDIKPENILVKGNTVFLTDFGLALDWSESGLTTTDQERRFSPVYCAPEVDGGKERNSMSDIWSLGCVFLEMITVLKGKPRSFVQETIMDTNGEKRYSRCWDGITGAIEVLRQDESIWDNRPLEWVELMLKKEKDDRRNSRDLRRIILQARAENGVAFCGDCCGLESSFDSDEEIRGAMRDVGDPVPRTSPPKTDACPKDRAARIRDPTTSKWRRVHVIRNPRISRSWISAETVNKNHFTSRQASEIGVCAFGGQRYESKECVDVAWHEFLPGNEKVRKGVFFVVPENGAPFELLLGEAGSSSASGQ